MRVFKMTKGNWIDCISGGLENPCVRCGKRQIIDYGVDDKFWKKIIPKELRQDVVCIECLQTIAKQKGYDIGSHLKEIQITLPGLTVDCLPCNLFYYD